MINFLKTGQKRSDGVLGWYSNGEVNYNINDITLDTYMHEFFSSMVKGIKKLEIKNHTMLYLKRHQILLNQNILLQN